MKKLFVCIALFGSLWSCQQSDKVEGRYGDESWQATNAMSGEQLLAELEGKDSVQATVSGTISAVCQAKGCWMKMDMAGNDMLVKFKDYGYFVPMNSSDYSATVKGWAYVDTLSIADQQELIRDSNKSDEEKETAIAEVTSPKVKLSFLADGVIIE
ncbi:MAG: DUF4920 domain-containing protein [Bacteroidia bacterium]|nr:DUF4920 domain-containing protein [Bacteroidia bacterium]